MKRIRLSMVTMLAVSLVFIAAGCGSGSDSGKTDSSHAPTVNTEPVTLKLYNWGPINEDIFNQLFVAQVKKKYPNITLELVQRGTNLQPENLVAGGTEVDMIIAGTDNMTNFTSIKLVQDMTDLIKGRNVDTGRFDPVIMGAVRDSQMLYGLPFGIKYNGLYYNKDLFDKFAVAYPKDGMTWEEATELAKRLTRTDAGVAYKGLDPENVAMPSGNLSLAVVDPQTNKATVNNDSWKKVFEAIGSIYKIPGNDLPIVAHAQTITRFTKEKNIAMLASSDLVGTLVDSDLNWDVAQYPSFKERPNTFNDARGYILMITTNSKYKEQAMDVINLMTSEEAQIQYTRNWAVPTPLKDPAINKQFGADIPKLQGKHTDSIFKSKSAPYVYQAEYTSVVRNIVTTKFNDYIKGKDLNTALREAEEEGTKKIQEAQK